MLIAISETMGGVGGDGLDLLTCMPDSICIIIVCVLIIVSNCRYGIP